MVQRQNVRNCLVQILRLVQHRLAMERSYVLIEVDCEKVQVPDASIDRSRIVPQHIVKVGCSLCGDGSNLLVAASISGNKENWNSFNL
jgi:hypothetical protein